MTKQPTRLADFQIPRETGVQKDSLTDEVRIDVPVSTSGPVLPMIPKSELPPPEVPRRALGARVPVTLAERLRVYLFVARRSQQEVVEAALDAYLNDRGA